MYFFPTQKMYQAVSTQAYDLALKTFFEHFYHHKTASENQVEFLLNAFCDLPGIKEAPQRQEQLKAFTRARADATGPSAMKKEDFVKFLEHFYFLLVTEDNMLKLSAKQKQNIWQGLESVYTHQICEPGMVTRLNSTFLESRADMQWISTELLKQRANKVQLLADQYNQQFDISDGYSVHTVHRMQQLAIEFKLGLQLEVDIDDIFLTAYERANIDRYFKKHYVENFKAYERECIDGLLSHLWSVYKEQYQPNLAITGMTTVVEAHSSPTTLESLRVELSVDNTAVLNRFLRDYLFEEQDLSLEHFCETSEDESTYFLLPDSTLKQAIKDALIKKLEKDGFFISSENLNTDNSAQAFFLGAHDKKSKMFQAFVFDFSNKAQFFQHGLENLIKYIDVLMDCPEMLTGILLQIPFFWDSLPRQLRQNHQFISCLIQALKGQEQNKAIQEIYKKIRFQNREYARFIDDDDYSSQPNTAERVNISVRSIFQLQQMADNITPSMIDGNTIQGLSPKAFARFYRALQASGLEWGLNQYLAMKKPLEGLASRYIPVLNEIDDQALLIESLHMHNNWVDALVYFQKNVMVLDLEFHPINSVENQLQLTWKAWLSLIINLLNCLIIILELAILIVFLMTINLLMLLPYLWLFDGPFIPIIIYSNLPLFAPIGVLCYLTILINFFMNQLDVFFVMTLKIAAAIALLCIGLDFIVIIYLAYILYSHEAIDYWMKISTSLVMIGNDTSLILATEIGQMLHSICAMVSPWLFRGVLNLFAMFRTYRADSAILDIENDILRLELSGAISGLQKADILRQIWCDVLVDLRSHNSLSIQDALNTPHQFTFKGQTFQMSYQQVAAIKRQKHLELDLNEPTGTVFSWFSSKTNKTLQSIPADLTLARMQ